MVFSSTVIFFIKKRDSVFIRINTVVISDSSKIWCKPVILAS